MSCNIFYSGSIAPVVIIMHFKMVAIVLHLKCQSLMMKGYQVDHMALEIKMGWRALPRSWCSGQGDGGQKTTLSMSYPKDYSNGLPLKRTISNEFYWRNYYSCIKIAHTLFIFVCTASVCRVIGSTFLVFNSCSLQLFTIIIQNGT